MNGVDITDTSCTCHWRAGRDTRCPIHGECRKIDVNSRGAAACPICGLTLPHPVYLGDSLGVCKGAAVTRIMIVEERIENVRETRFTLRCHTSANQTDDVLWVSIPHGQDIPWSVGSHVTLTMEVK